MAESGRGTDAILGHAPGIVALRAQVQRLAAFDTPGNPRVPTILLQGETGSGKGLVARVIHDSGPRADAAFVDVNCGAIPETMIEAELFGFEAGAFTDAKRAKPGLFEAASGGTLFLDEIDSLPLALQSKVLTAIEEKRVRRLGAVSPRDVDVKLIAATQKELKAAVAAGEFRADLYHRLAVVVLAIPPLRDRGDDVLFLAERLLASYAEGHGVGAKRLGPSARSWLSAYGWPGNVRELAHLMERITLLAPEDEVHGESLRELAEPSAVSYEATPRSSTSESDRVGRFEDDERARIESALQRAGGNVVRAAKSLGIGRNALRYRMRRLGINRSDETDSSPVVAAAPPVRAADVAADGVADDAKEEAPPLQSSWEQRPMAVLCISIAFPEPRATGYEPWTVAKRWGRIIDDKVTGFGGVFLERSSSRLTAAFGVPRAVEQMADRAVQAALAIQRVAAGPGAPEIRAVLHVGEVRVDIGAVDPLAELFPVGSTFSLPERLIGHAGGGEVLISPEVARRVERGFALQPRTVKLGPAEKDSLTVHAVVGQRSRLATIEATSSPSLTGFVGREREIDLLCEAFSRAAAGHGQVVFIAGDAGIGKSRLLMELRQRLRDQPHVWIEGQCASYGTTTPFLPIIDGLRRYFGIDDRDDEASAATKIGREVERLGPQLDWTLPFMRQLLSLGVSDESVRALDSASRRSESVRALRALLLRAAEQSPVALVVEDLHWIDPASEELLTFLSDAIPAASVLLVLSHRTGYRQPFGDRSYHSRVTLAPLSRAEMAAMTSSILGTNEIPGQLGTLIASKAEGNPFFVEELTKSLLEDGSVCAENGRLTLKPDLEELSVPETIQDVLIARIDRLAEESRRAIQLASVIGREFALRLLARITEMGDRIRSSVDELRGLELIYEKALHPELAYMFKHALTHDVAYESLVHERRRALHRTIGLAIEELYADRLAEHYETLAHHFGRGEDWERALLYHEKSAEKAAENHANRAVVEHCRAALAIAERLGEQVPNSVRYRLNSTLGTACFYLSEFAAAGAAQEAAAACSDEPLVHALSLGEAAFSHFWAHRYEPSQRCIDTALAFSRANRVPAGEALALMVQGFYRGVHDADIDGYERTIQQGREICARDPHEGVEAFARYQTVMVAEWTGAYPKALAMGESAIELARRLRRADILILSIWFVAKARCCIGDYGGAIALLEEAYQLCDRIGDRAWKSRLLNTLGWCFAELGIPGRARAYNERAAALAREVGDPEILANADVNLAQNHLAMNDIDAALAFLEPLEAKVAAQSDPWMLWRYRLHVVHTRARVSLIRGALDAALAAADEELAGARRHRAPKLEARAWLLRATALVEGDVRDGAAEALAEAFAIGERIGYQRAIAEAHRLSAVLARRAGDQPLLDRHTAAAVAVAKRAVESIADAEIKREVMANLDGQQRVEEGE